MLRKDLNEVFEGNPMACPPGENEWLLLDGEHRAILFYNDSGMKAKYQVSYNPYGLVKLVDGPDLSPF